VFLFFFRFAANDKNQFEHKNKRKAIQKLVVRHLFVESIQNKESIEVNDLQFLKINSWCVARQQL
jgi:hypothetical protein